MKKDIHNVICGCDINDIIINYDKYNTKKNCCIYGLINKENKIVYVGSHLGTKHYNFIHRISKHYSNFKINIKKTILYKEENKDINYIIDNYKVIILEQYKLIKTDNNKKKIRIYEQYYIDIYEPILNQRKAINLKTKTALIKCNCGCKVNIYNNSFQNLNLHLKTIKHYRNLYNLCIKQLGYLE